MSDEINKFCDEIIEAGEKATPRPWRVHWDYDDDGRGGEYKYPTHISSPSTKRRVWDHDAIGEDGPEYNTPNDAKLIVLACNSAPAIAAALKRAVEFIDTIHAQGHGTYAAAACAALSDISKLLAAAKEK